MCPVGVHAPLVREVSWYILLRVDATSAHDKSTGLDGVGPRRRMSPEQAFLICLLQTRTGVKGKRAGIDGDVNVLALRDHGCTGERHEVLAADQTTDAANVGVEHEQIGPIALAPEQPLDEGRMELAVAAKKLAVATDEQQSVVDRLDLGTEIELVTADRHIDIGSRAAWLKRSVSSLGMTSAASRNRMRASIQAGICDSHPSLQNG